ncbi:MAG: hypothetical protein NVSMB17_08150 [Candidatus Dormibacteria bacterium]
MGTAIASWTRGGTGVGPGPRNGNLMAGRFYRRPAAAQRLRSRAEKYTFCAKFGMRSEGPGFPGSKGHEGGWPGIQ